MRQAVSLLFGLVVSIPLLFGESNELRSIDPKENKLLSKLSEKELRGLFKKKSKGDALEGLFEKEKYEVITNLDLNGDGKGENLYGQRYEIEFSHPENKPIFSLKKFICIEEGVNERFRVLFIADEDRFLTRRKTTVTFDPAEYKGQTFLRWWFLTFHPFLRKENAFLIRMRWIKNREFAKTVGGGSPLGELSALRWNPKTEDFEVDEELSKKYAY